MDETQKASNILDLGLDLAAKKNLELTAQRTLQFVGNKQSSKTSLIYRFVDRNDNPKPTLALEYTFARKKRISEAGKDVCDIWELASGTLFSNLLEFSINKENIGSLSVVVVLDLSTPEELVITAESLISELRQRIDSLISLTKNEKQFKENAIQRVGSDHKDIDALTLFPLPILILGSKYDLFQEFEFEKKKVIAQYLRLLAHSIGASLMFVTTKSEALINKMKSFLAQLAFDSALANQSLSTDFNRPLYVTFGSDSFAAIGKQSLESSRNEFVTLFPQKGAKVVIPDDPARDPNFKERDIDLIYVQRIKQLEELKRQIDMKYSLE